MDKNKLLSPWTAYTDRDDIKEADIILVRWRIGGDDSQPELWGAWVAYYDDDKSFASAIRVVASKSNFASLQDGKNLIDEKLVELGYMLCDQEQWDKYLLLI